MCSRSAFNLFTANKTTAPWGAPAALLGGWLAWPALTDDFKSETLGLPGSSSEAAAAGKWYKAGPGAVPSKSPPEKDDDDDDDE